ncbi:glyoxylate reductase/hydroxypyruvate reductase-like [Centruroides vittatus]|uniref:glyoxylate reductase/hydroxypyruvate reductase-like n=1 Tax=Centruroides vittatus TaxID=120091 RepID=UPI0035100CE9
MAQRFSVLVTRVDVPKESIELLQKTCEVETWPKASAIPRDVLLEKIAGKDALYCQMADKVDKELLNAAGSQLKVIGTMSVGFDHIDLPECKKRNILVGNTPDVLTDDVAELTISLLLATSRRIFEASEELRNGKWISCGWAPLWMCGTSIKGSTIGIVGMGRIGCAVVEKLQGFKVDQFLYCGNKQKERANELGAKFVTFDELLKNSDFIISCCALNAQTKELFNERAFSLMKPTAIFINTSRGGVVDQNALYQALTTGQIKAAGLDVMTPEPLPPDHPLTELNNCVLLPHIGSATVSTRVSMAMLTARNILAGLEGKPLPSPL